MDGGVRKRTAARLRRGGPAAAGSADPAVLAVADVESVPALLRTGDDVPAVSLACQLEAETVVGARAGPGRGACQSEGYENGAQAKTELTNHMGSPEMERAAHRLSPVQECAGLEAHRDDGSAVTRSGIIHIPPLDRSEVPTLGSTKKPGARRGR